MNKYKNFDEALNDFEAFMSEDNDGVRVAPVVMEGYKPSIFNNIDIRISQFLRSTEVQAIGFGLSLGAIHLVDAISNFK
jgi:hypothetical protein